MILLFETGAVLDVGRIANGAQASLGEFPYVASVQLRNEQHLCGGFIYNEFYVVTAASCLAG